MNEQLESIIGRFDVIAEALVKLRSEVIDLAPPVAITPDEAAPPVDEDGGPLLDEDEAAPPLDEHDVDDLQPLNEDAADESIPTTEEPQLTF